MITDKTVSAAPRTTWPVIASMLISPMLRVDIASIGRLFGNGGSRECLVLHDSMVGGSHPSLTKGGSWVL